MAAARREEALASDTHVRDALVNERLRETEALEIRGPRLLLALRPAPLLSSHALVDFSPERVIASVQLGAPLGNAEDLNAGQKLCMWGRRRLDHDVAIYTSAVTAKVVVVPLSRLLFTNQNSKHILP